MARLKRIGIVPDNFHGVNNAIRPDNTRRYGRIKIIDLEEYAGPWDRNPWECGPNEFYIAGGVSRDFGELDDLTHAEFIRRATASREAFANRQTGVDKEAILSGSKQIVSEDDLSKVNENITVHTRFLDYLRRYAIPFDHDPRITFSLGGHLKGETHQEVQIAGEEARKSTVVEGVFTQTGATYEVREVSKQTSLTQKSPSGQSQESTEYLNIEAAPLYVAFENIVTTLSQGLQQTDRITYMYDLFNQRVIKRVGDQGSQQASLEELIQYARTNFGVAWAAELPHLAEAQIQDKLMQQLGMWMTKLPSDTGES